MVCLCEFDSNNNDMNDNKNDLKIERELNLMRESPTGRTDRIGLEALFNQQLLTLCFVSIVIIKRFVLFN